jgi:N-methylhydantoinase B
VSTPSTSPAATAIRDLDEQRFRERFACDRFEATVLANRFGYVVEHMCSQLLTTAFSPILRDFYDFAATVTGPPSCGWPTPAVSNSIILFTGTMADSVRNTIEEYGVERLEPGDVIVANDPYRTGTHVNDLLFSRPVFHGLELAGFVNLKAHHLDMGGVVPGGFSASKRSVYENGIVVSPRALYRAGAPVRETWSLIFDNVRFGELMFPDMQTICANLELGERLLTETVERYGLRAVLGAMAYVCDAAAERMERALAELPDGSWEGEDVVDCDGVDDSEAYRVHVRVTKVGGRAEVDLSGTSRQARSCINGTALDAKTTVGVAFKYLFDPLSPFTSGTIRPIDIVLPEGTIVSALPPDGAVFLYWEGTQALMSALLRAFAQVLGPAAIAGDQCSANLHNAHGVLPNGRPWASVGQCGGEHGSWGATADGDADAYTLTYQANGIAPAIEAIESDFPVAVLRREVVPDTGGPGYHRGGPGVVKDSLWLAPASHYAMPLRYRVASGFGVNGGRDGETGGVWIWDGDAGGAVTMRALTAEAYRDSTPVSGCLDPATQAPSRAGEFVYFGRRPVWQTRPNATLRYVTNGGGGWGDPLDREPERVVRDVRDGYVTLEGAARDYGVVVSGDPEDDPEGLVVDLAATERLRRSLRAERSGG